MRVPHVQFRNRIRSGFTLIELLIVIAIISILAGLILGAVQMVRGKVRVAEVVAEFSQIETALAGFESKYGKLPPSSITLYKNANAWDTRSASIIKTIWPQFDFSNAGGLNFPGTTTSVTLDGSECLVFFLGGVADSGGALSGFSSDPRLPFKSTGNRIGPFYEFKGHYDTVKGEWSGRLIETEATPDGVPGYADTVTGTQPYFYISSYGGKYRPGEQNGFDEYRRGQPANSQRYNAKKFQLICAGSDATFGVGGYFDAEAEVIGSDADRDNITNFHGGELLP
ncbi:MAG: type II secretion system protein [Planctomycetota bacterium]|nr:type II secretion system protein [Planctomycetota bacterium]